MYEIPALCYLEKLLEQIRRMNQENITQAKLITALEDKVRLLELKIKLLKEQRQSVS